MGFFRVDVVEYWCGFFCVTWVVMLTVAPPTVVVGVHRSALGCVVLSGFEVSLVTSRPPQEVVVFLFLVSILKR